MPDGYNLDEIFSRIKNGTTEDKKNLADELKKTLSAEQTETLNKLMSDKGLMEKLLKSDEAKNIIDKIGGDNIGHK